MKPEQAQAGRAGSWPARQNLNPDTATGGPARAAALVLACSAALVLAGCGLHAAENPGAPQRSDATAAGKAGENRVRVQGDQVAALELAPAGERRFEHLRGAIGIIDFNQDRQVQVLPAYQGRVSQVLVKAGDEVRAGQVLYTVQVPDVAQAAAALITASGNRRNAQEVLERARNLAGDDSIPKKEWRQNETDAQAAEASYQSARQSMRLFGLGEAEIDRIEQKRQVDIEMPVRSPLAGRVTARQVQPGLLVQPGMTPAPVTVADLGTVWMVASVPESEVAAYRLGQPVRVQVPAFPGRVFPGVINYLSDAVDPATHRLALRAEVPNPGRALRPQMSAEFTIETAAAENGLAVPATALVRESDGSTNVWLLEGRDANGATLRRQPVTLGAQSGGQVQVTGGLQRGQTLAQKNALFLSNLYATDTR